MSKQLRDTIQAKLSSRKESGWKDLCAENFAVKNEFINLVSESIAKGKNPTKARFALDQMLFNGINIEDVDVIMRLK